MILVVHKELIFANREQYIGTVGDSNSAVRVFQIKRVCVDGVDIADLSFRLNAELPDKSPDTAYLEKEVRDEDILLTWTISANMTSQPGTLFINLRGHDDTGSLKWASYRAPVYVEGITGQPAVSGLSEIEELERQIDKKLSMVDTTEAVRQHNEAQRQQNEAERQQSEAEREKKTSAVIATFGAAIDAAEQNAKLAKSYAVGESGIRGGENTDNAKYYAQQSELYKGAAKEAESEAKNARDDLIERIASGEFTGPQGPQGPPGVNGESGVNIPASSFLYIYTDDADNSAIHCVYDDAVNEVPPVKYRIGRGYLLEL